jgi:histidyl-tRNA synthetase
VSSIQAIRGMNDILPNQTAWWQYVETLCSELARQYGYREIRFPIVEKTELFKRSVGEVTDIVEKEMYTFAARNGDSLSLRPEGTACCVRAGLQHGLIAHGVQRLWYAGPMYRHERPQKGRYRQFHQFGLELFGVESVAAEAEQLAFMWRFFGYLGLQEDVTLEVNSLGSQQCRQNYKEALVEYFTQHEASLDEDCQRRLGSNPLRILDSKNPEMQSLIAAAPEFSDYLSDESAASFSQLQQYLQGLEIPYQLNTRLVRGLDYYSNAVYEWKTDALGAQGTICAGGRYDKLVDLLGGKPTSAVGFALGIERLILLLQAKRSQHSPAVPLDVYFVLVGEQALQHGLRVTEHLRSELPQLNITINSQGGSFKSQFKRADKLGARFALVLGDNEIEQGVLSLKFLRKAESEQLTLPIDDIIQVLKKESEA